ncbi:transcription factor RelB homolog isoform X1 [Nothobranchius furzeri]|uniref:Transcript variant X1 n=2 Tax=Nothobranchius furzeri TaxID=105023 RepID=A0A9D3BSW7_NOTFU|nr:transcription factor RelB homolog isoform X1 [Nothobranchius furzeri]KAF7218875.1 transcript variant X1 [Nothobranchius furzeri]
MKGMDVFNDTSAEKPTPNPGMSARLPGALFHGSNGELELIEEYLKESCDFPVSALPGPPPPPPDPFCSPPLHQNHRTLHQNPSPTSNPVLVPRGAPCKPIFHSMQQTARPTSTLPSPRAAISSSAAFSDRARGSPCSMALKGSVSSQSQCDNEPLAQILDKPRLVVVEEPKDRGMRFRYQCEGRSAGSILGASSTDSNKTQPTIEIQGDISHIKKVTVTTSLVTKDPPHRPHPHALVGKDCPVSTGICVVSFNPNTNRCHSFANLGIQCVKRKELDDSLQKRRNQNIDPFQTGHSKGIEDMDMNSVRLCFQCELEWEDGRKDSLSPVVSKPIYDKKATTTSELKIYNLNKFKGSCKGKTEVYMLCDKVQKDDIEILFRQGSWKANGEFAQTEVHRQVAIVFKTPPYQDQDITEEVEVNVLLRRISDQMESDPITFTYLPNNTDPYEVKRKRATTKRDASVFKNSCPTETTPPPPDQTYSNPTQMFLHENHPTDTTTQMDRYLEPLDAERLAQELIENPNLIAMLDNNIFFDMDTNILANMSTNFNTNYGLHSQEFLPFNDIQFNPLVSENQNPQPELHDGTMQVKTEEL